MTPVSLYYGCGERIPKGSRLETLTSDLLTVGVQALDVIATFLLGLESRVRQLQRMHFMRHS